MTMKKSAVPAALFLLLALAGGCGMAAYDQLPPLPERAASAEAELPDYRIFPHDNLEVTVYGHSDLSRGTQVSADGRITFPLIGQVMVAGLTAHEAEGLLAEKFARYIVSPQVTVIVPQVPGRVARREEQREKVFVSGQVRRPGVYDWRRGLTVYEVITAAGGPTSVAAPNRTRVIRRGEDGDETIPVPVAEMMRRGDMSRDIPLEPGDVVFVPESFF